MKIQVCTGKTCSERYSQYILTRLEKEKSLFALDNLIVEACPCTGNCKDGPNILVDGKLEIHCNPIKASKFALQSKLRLKKKEKVVEETRRSAGDSPEETLYLKDHINLVKKTPDDTSDL